MSFGGPQWPQQGPGQQPYGPGQGQSQQGYGQGQQPPQQPPWQQHPPHQQHPQQHQPGGFPGTQPDGTPDWGALADASATRDRRKRRLMIGGGALAALAVGAAVATTIVVTNKSNDEAKNGGTAPTGSAAPSDTATPSPTFSSVAPLPPPNPRDYISDAKKDTAPLSAEGLFPGTKLTMSGRPYRKGATASTTNCAAVTVGGLGSALAANGCTRVLRATYVKDGVAVTVGVAVFPTEKQATQAKKQATGGIATLPGAGVGDFCHATVCLRRTNAIGRYVYLTQAGFQNGRKVTTGDQSVFQASDDLGTFAFNQIYARGKAQASAAADAPAR
ncbi:hypothetical protein AB0C52_35295 [Streptomyces sp. NPDC048717]|uniref:hypothetical protein n=1 Tax=Streptomyces sp. NPDC048717 TaxID=3154928 RepID=UPI00342139C3